MRTRNSRSSTNSESTALAADELASADELVKLGQDLLAQQRAIREKIPDFTLPHPSRARLAGTAARVTEATVNEGLAACTTHPSLASAIDAGEVQYAQDYELAFAELRDEMEKSFVGLDYSIRLKRRNNGKAMLRILAVARSLVKSPENAGLAVHIEAMKKGFKRRRREPNTTKTSPPSVIPTAGDTSAAASRAE